MNAIGEEVMVRACTGHVRRLATPERIQNALIEVSASSDEVANAVLSLIDIRDDGSVDLNREAYAAALLEGCILGMRAARIAEGML